MKIEIKDFQAHSNTVLNVKAGLVCVVGSTNSGKSSIVRALRSLIYDSIRGIRYVRFGRDSACIKVEFDDVAIGKIKGKKVNRYVVGGNQFDAIGVGIPVEAVKSLNMPLVQVDKDLSVELNLSSQMAPPFLILDNDSTRAKFLNVLTGGHILDAALRETNRKIRELDDTRKGINVQLDSDKERLKAFADIPAKEYTLSGIKDKLERLEALEKSVEKLETIRATLDLVRVKKQRVDEGLVVLARYDWAWALQRLTVIQQTVETLEHLANVRSQLVTLSAKLRTLEKHDWSQFLARLNRIMEVTNLVDNTKRIRDSLQPIQRKLSFVAGIDCVAASNRLSTIVSTMEVGERLRSVRLSYGMLTGQEATLEVELAVVKAKFLELPTQICEACGQEISREFREKHLKEMAHA